MMWMPSGSQKIRARTFPEIFDLRSFWGGESRFAATSLIVALSSGHRDINRFRPLSTIATGNNLDCAEKIPKFDQTTGAVHVLDSSSGISGPTTWRASTCPNPHE